MQTDETVLADRIKRTLALHTPRTWRHQVDYQPVSVCEECNADWPCETVEILEGSR